MAVEDSPEAKYVLQTNGRFIGAPRKTEFGKLAMGSIDYKG